MNNTYGSIRPSLVDISNDVEIFYHYRPTRNSEDENFSSFKKVKDVTSMLSIAEFEDEKEETNDFRLPGMYNLSLPVSIFSQIGFYTIYIRPKEIKAREDLIKKLVEEEKIIRSWAVYKELIGKNGILKLVLKRALPIINNEISTLLNGLVDFEVVLSISDDNKVCIDLVHDGVAMSVGRAASGYEETMASLALRSALATVSSFAKPNLLVLDEIFGATGSSHYDDIRELLNRIMKNHDFVIDITHNEMITDWHNQIIEVVKENNISKLTVK